MNKKYSKLAIYLHIILFVYTFHQIKKKKIKKILESGYKGYKSYYCYVPTLIRSFLYLSSGYNWIQKKWASNTNTYSSNFVSSCFVLFSTIVIYQHLFIEFLKKSSRSEQYRQHKGRAHMKGIFFIYDLLREEYTKIWKEKKAGSGMGDRVFQRSSISKIIMIFLKNRLGW